MRHTRISLAAAATVAALTLTACGADTSQGSAERADKPVKAEDADAGEEHEDEPAEDLPDTELSVGDTFAYDDGVKVRLDSIVPLSGYNPADYGDDEPGWGFRLNWTITNGTKKPLKLDEWFSNTVGATSGGDTSPIMWDEGVKEMTGRLAAGRSAKFTDELAIAKADGKKVTSTMTRVDEEFELFANDPSWTGTIK